MTSPRSAAEADLARRLLPVARRWRGEADAVLAGFGLSTASAWVLLHVARLGDAVRQRVLADAVDIQGASLVRLIDRLEGAGLVERTAQAGDKRVNRVRLTPAGTALTGEIEATLATIRHDLCDGVSDADLDAANRVLAHVQAGLLARRGAAR
jgi:MarR family transcriptional regulator for hemolysin